MRGELRQQAANTASLWSCPESRDPLSVPGATGSPWDGARAGLPRRDFAGSSHKYRRRARYLLLIRTFLLEKNYRVQRGIYK